MVINSKLANGIKMIFLLFSFFSPNKNLLECITAPTVIQFQIALQDDGVQQAPRKQLKQEMLPDVSR